MLRVIEAFSGIGSQAKALERENIEHEILATIDWDINAILAYDIIHNGPQELGQYDKLNKSQLIEKLSSYKLSNNGKEPIKKEAFVHMSERLLRSLLAAIVRCNNLVSITDVKAADLPDDVDLFTYSFPCQDLSICSAWHGNHSGINRNVHNRSGMLWEVERILKEYVTIERPLPKFLLMENVSNILSKEHFTNFLEWQAYLKEIGYENKIYTLNALDFGVPQKRERTFMLSILCNDINRAQVNVFLKEHDLSSVKKKLKPLSEFLRLDYGNAKYRYEADMSNPNYTESRQKIHHENDMIFEDGKYLSYIKTITTKQDRNPNSGLIEYMINPTKAPYRNLTPRECFLLMGFDEYDFQALMDNDIFQDRSRKFYSREKLIKMAGNSIVVNVLQEIFKIIDELKRELYI